MSAFALSIVTGAVLLAAGLAVRLGRRRRPCRFAAGCFEDWFANDMPVPFGLIDADGMIIRINAKATEHSGASGSHLVGTPLADLLPDAVVPLFLYRLAKRDRLEPILIITTATGDLSGWGNAKGLTLIPVRKRNGRVGGHIVMLSDLVDEESPALTRDDLLRSMGGGPAGEQTMPSSDTEGMAT